MLHSAFKVCGHHAYRHRIVVLAALVLAHITMVRLSMLSLMPVAFHRDFLLNSTLAVY
jgi:hypothetical protein